MMPSLMLIPMLVAISVFSINISTPKANPEVFRRFLFVVTCEECYQCICKNQWEKCGQWPRDWVRQGCPKYIDNTEDCKAPLHQHGGWTSWASWGNCIGDCGKQRRVRHRSCSNPKPKNCGGTCPGNGAQSKHCITHQCRTHASVTTTTTKATTTTTTTKATTTTTTTTTTRPTTTQPTSTTTLAPQSCGKFCTVASVAQNHTLIEDDAPVCKTGEHRGSEALPIHCCNLNDPSNWKRGANVLLHCNKLSGYIPVGLFDGTHYMPGTAGVFVDCLNNGETGFRFIRQACNIQPEIVHVSLNNSNFASKVINYYVILQ